MALEEAVWTLVKAVKHEAVGLSLGEYLAGDISADNGSALLMGRRFCQNNELAAAVKALTSERETEQAVEGRLTYVRINSEDDEDITRSDRSSKEESGARSLPNGAIDYLHLEESGTIRVSDSSQGLVLADLTELKDGVKQCDSAPAAETRRTLFFEVVRILGIGGLAILLLPVEDDAESLRALECLLPNFKVLVYSTAEGQLKAENCVTLHKLGPTREDIEGLRRLDLAGWALEDEEEEEEEEEDGEYLPSYHCYRDIEPQLELLKNSYDVLLQEMTAASTVRWTQWPESHYDKGKGNDWRVFPFCYTFPADDASQTKWVESTTSLCPKTTEILKSIPNVRTALYSRLSPGTTLAPHRGWAELSNHVLRCHLGLVVPTAQRASTEEGQCGMWVDGEVQCHRERELLMFDDSKLHYAFNRSDGDRVILIVDVARPTHIPKGRAAGAKTNELEAFIQQFSV